jgi:hypothetical protein
MERVVPTRARVAELYNVDVPLFPDDYGMAARKRKSELNVSGRWAKIPIISPFLDEVKFHRIRGDVE